MPSKSPLFTYSLLYLAGISVGRALKVELWIVIVISLLLFVVSYLLFMYNQTKHSGLTNKLLRRSCNFTLISLGCWAIIAADASQIESREPISRLGLFVTKEIGVEIKEKRDLIIDKIEVVSEKEEWGKIFIAILFGQKGELDRTTKNAFKKAGVLHLMAVSGMHINIVYLALIRLLFFIDGRVILRYIRAFIALSFVWLYCAFCDFTPSALRATIMASLLTISQLNKTQYSTLNALGGAALIITIIEPGSLFMVGFQLSFMAVISIVVISPYFLNLIYFRSKILRYLYSLVVISLSCQLGTSPISIIYFGEFPTYFLISNLMLIPLTTVTITTSVIVAIGGASSFMVEMGASVIKETINLMSSVVQKIESLPLSSIRIESHSLKGIIVIFSITLCSLYCIMKGYFGSELES